MPQPRLGSTPTSSKPPMATLRSTWGRPSTLRRVSGIGRHSREMRLERRRGARILSRLAVYGIRDNPPTRAVVRWPRLVTKPEWHDLEGDIHATVGRRLREGGDVNTKLGCFGAIEQQHASERREIDCEQPTRDAALQVRPKLAVRSARDSRERACEDRDVETKRIGKRLWISAEYKTPQRAIPLTELRAAADREHHGQHLAHEAAREDALEDQWLPPRVHRLTVHSCNASGHGRECLCCAPCPLLVLAPPSRTTEVVAVETQRVATDSTLLCGPGTRKVDRVAPEHVHQLGRAAAALVERAARRQVLLCERGPLTTDPAVAFVWCGREEADSLTDGGSGHFCHERLQVLERRVRMRDEDQTISARRTVVGTLRLWLLHRLHSLARRTRFLFAERGQAGVAI